MLQDDITRFVDLPAIDVWAEENTAWLLTLIILVGVGLYIFKPKLVYWCQLIRQRRLYWSYQALVGRKMSKRAKDLQVSEAIYDMLLNLVNKGIITGKDKRKYLRTMEIAFELEPGTLRPTPSASELKRRIRGRLSADSANSSSVKPIRRLASIMNSKG